ncbi:hypothetical protein D3C86_1194300 [compost metagenome]
MYALAVLDMRGLGVIGDDVLVLLSIYKLQVIAYGISHHTTAYFQVLCCTIDRERSFYQ